MTGTLAAIFLAYTVASSLSIYPHSLSYFNELAAVLPTPTDASYPKANDESGEHRSLWPSVQDAVSAGPRNGPRHLLDSNIDWGQDLYYLEDWYLSHPEARPMKVAYFGSYPLEKTKIESAGVPPIGRDREHIDGNTDATAFGPLPGWYALSVNEIYGQSQRYRYFLNFRPVATAGYSIYIYHVTLDEATRVRREMGLLELSRLNPSPPAPLPMGEGEQDARTLSRRQREPMKKQAEMKTMNESYGPRWIAEKESSCWRVGLRSPRSRFGKNGNRI